MQIDIKPNDVIHSYLFEHPLGYGNNGMVWQGYHEYLNVPVAIKVMDIHGLAPEAREQIKEQCRRISKLKHDRIVEIHNAFPEGELFFIVMELMPGGSLDRYLRRYTRPDFGLTLTWALDLCAALAEIHARDIFHANLKPQNILMTNDNQVKLSIEVAWSGGGPATVYPPGEVTYWPPEQEAGDAVDGGVDIYALCAVLFEIWTGKLYAQYKGSSPDIVREEMILLISKNYSGLPTALRNRLVDAVQAGLAPQAERITLRGLQTVLRAIQEEAVGRVETEIKPLAQAQERSDEFMILAEAINGLQAMMREMQRTLTEGGSSTPRLSAKTATVEAPPAQEEQPGSNHRPAAPTQAMEFASPTPERGGGNHRHMAPTQVVPAAPGGGHPAPQMIEHAPSGPPASVTVAPDERGGTPTLAEAIAGVVEGGTIYLLPGEHRLPSPLVIDKAVRLAGAGMAATRIIGTGPEYVAIFTGPGRLELEGITFLYQGEAGADILIVTAGEIALTHCAFSGAVLDAQGRGGRGLWLSGMITGQVSGCTATNNGLHGISVDGQSQPLLEQNICQENTYNGIYYTDAAAGVARGNQCQTNGHGIYVDGQARPVLEGNNCSGNGIGLAYVAAAGGVAAGNECSRNSYDGIRVGQRARPKLERNLCQENRGGGIFFTDEAAGLARANECAGNKRGITVMKKAQPILDGNNCQENEVGIFINNTANPKLKENSCRRNKNDLVDRRKSFMRMLFSDLFD
jgi:parallel beta-helix repeat protein